MEKERRQKVVATRGNKSMLGLTRIHVRKFVSISCYLYVGLQKGYFIIRLASPYQSVFQMTEWKIVHSNRVKSEKFRLKPMNLKRISIFELFPLNLGRSSYIILSTDNAKQDSTGGAAQSAG